MIDSADQPTLFILAGPNGAGKSTLYKHRLQPREPGIEFVNADLLARAALGRHASSLEDAQLGQRLADERRVQLMEARQSLITETVFSHPSKLDLIDHAKDLGYRVVVLHVNVDDPMKSVQRVASRVQQGGHPVPEDKIRERYERNKPLILQAIQRADDGFIYDNSQHLRPHRLIAQTRHGELTRMAASLPQWASEQYAPLLRNHPARQATSAKLAIQQAADQVRQMAGPDVGVFLPVYQSSYEGEIVGKTAAVAIQQGTDKSVILHLRQRLNDPVRIGERVTIDYPARRPRAEVHHHPLPGPRAELAQAWLEHGAFAVQSFPGELETLRKAENLQLEAVARAVPAIDDLARQNDREFIASRVADLIATDQIRDRSIDELIAAAMPRLSQPKAPEARGPAPGDRPDDLAARRLVVMNGQAALQTKGEDGRWSDVVRRPAGDLPTGNWSLNVREAARGSDYTGHVLHVDTRSVYQVVGRDVVRHERERFEQTPEVGQRVRIAQADGKLRAEPAKDVGRGRGKSR